MSKKAKLLAKLADRASDKNWSLAEAEAVLALLGFTKDRQNGSHRSYIRPGYPQLIGLCPHGKQGILPVYIRAIREVHTDIETQAKDKP